MRDALRWGLLTAAFAWLFSQPIAPLNAQGANCDCYGHVYGYMGSPTPATECIDNVAQFYIYHPTVYGCAVTCYWAMHLAANNLCGGQCWKDGAAHEVVGWSYGGFWQSWAADGGFGSVGNYGQCGFL
jgi:hypothetical protein